MVQGTLLGFLGLLLAFGLTMAVGRYESRRTLIVQEANDIGTTYLRAQLLPEPFRSESLDLLRSYTSTAVDLADQVSDSARFDADLASMDQLQRELWAVAGRAVADDAVGTGPRLYVESINPMFDTHTERVASLRNHVPTTVSLLQVLGSAVALGVLALYLAMLGRGLTTALAAAAVVILIVLISFDLDRPQRGFITVPFAPLTDLRASMDLPPPTDGGG